MPLIQIDLQAGLSEGQRAALRERVGRVVCDAIGAPDPYISIVIREWPASALVESGKSGPYHDRKPFAAAAEPPGAA